MLKRDLGQSGISASVVAVGAWAMGGWMWGGTDEKESIGAIHAALDAGVDFVDTAPIYGFGLSEEIVGKALKGRRDKVVLATKCGMVAHPGVGEEKFRSNALGPDPDGHLIIHLYNNPDSIRAEVEASLKRLQTDYIDLLQTHWQESTTPIEDTMAAMMDLKQQGKIRAIGVCNATVDHVKQYRQGGPLDSDQEKYSMLDRDIEQKQLPFCRENNIAVLAYSPLSKGLLTGTCGPDREFNEGDQRRSEERFSAKNRKRVAEMLDQFRLVADGRGISTAQLVTAWTFHQPGLTHVLVGARNAEQGRENAAAGEIELTEDELKTIDAAINEYAGAAVE
jgi:aryl-alcohol dehydrogenase-like predicted oxidoreductase